MSEETPKVVEIPPESVEKMDISEDADMDANAPIDICGDGSIMKEILQEGSGDETPTSGSNVTVHYTGTLLDGSKFDSSVDRGQPFNFKIGQGQVIKGWDEGVATMKQGEKAKFTIKSHKAYGKSGSPPKIPADADLIFEVELISWTSKMDISPDKDNSLTKKVIKDGSGINKPDDLSAVSVKMSIKAGDEVILDSGDKPFEFVIDEAQAMSGIELCIKSMKKGEKAQFTIQPKHTAGSFNYGRDKDVAAPDQATITADIELIGLEKAKETWDMSTTEKLEQMDSLRLKGNDWFKKGDYQRAIRRYDSAINCASSDYSFSDEEKEQAKQRKLPCLLNQSQCYLKLKNFTQAKAKATEALEVDEKNVKGLFRRGTAQMEMGDWDEAKNDFKAVLEIDSENKAALVAMKKVNALIAKEKAREKKMFSGMFDKFAAEDASKEPPKTDETTQAEESDDKEESDEKEASTAPMDTSEVAESDA